MKKRVFKNLLMLFPSSFLFSSKSQLLYTFLNQKFPNCEQSVSTLSLRLFQTSPNDRLDGTQSKHIIRKSSTTKVDYVLNLNVMPCLLSVTSI